MRLKYAIKPVRCLEVSAEGQFEKQRRKLVTKNFRVWKQRSTKSKRSFSENEESSATPRGSQGACLGVLQMGNEVR